MDRFAVFVDAGYLFAAGGIATCGTKARSQLAFDARGFAAMLLPRLQAVSGLPLLRMYWYDGAKRGIPTVEQQVVAGLPNVKLRLGRLNGRNEQKGVDALIYRDIITLASRRAVADAYLLSGDEDLREGVRAAQDLGVRVGLVGIDERGRRNQSAELRDEVDEHLVLRAADLAPFFQRRSHLAAPAGAGGAPVPPPGSAALGALQVEGG